MLGLIVSIKNIKQNIQENVVQCWFYFYDTSIKILLLISKPHPALLPIHRLNANAGFCKTNTVI